MRRFSACLLIFISLASTSPSSPPEGLAKKSVDAWRLVAVEGNPPGRPGVYDRPTGLLMYDSSGHISVQIVIRADRKSSGPYTKGLLSATLDEKAAAFDNYAAYFGTYAVDAEAGTVTHHLENNLVPGRQGTDNVRWFEFPRDNHLYLIPMEDGKGGV